MFTLDLNILENPASLPDSSDAYCMACWFIYNVAK